MNDSTLRAWWSHRQGLDGSLRDATPAEVLERSGWARSVGGVGPYLTLHARAGTTRQAADDAVAALEIHELPAARGCTYVVPARDYALGLAAGRAFGDGDFRQAVKLGVTEDEVERLCDAVLRALTGAPLDPAAIREAVGDAARSLGPEGKKKGLTTTLPLALGRLQARGDIRRVPVNGRLDNQRYAYVRWTPNPLAGAPASPDAAYTELARRFFRWVGPATLKELQWFSALGVAASRKAVEPLGLVPMEEGSDRLLLPEDVDAFHAFEMPADPQYALVSSLDAVSATRRDVRTLVDPADQARTVQLEKQVGTLGGLVDLPSHAILDRGRLVGFWEFDHARGEIAWASFVKPDAALVATVKETEAFVRDQLGDARSFSLDSPASRGPRIEALRAMA